MNKTIDTNILKEQFEEFRQNTIKAFERLLKMKGKNFKLEDTAHSAILSENVTCSELMKAAVDVIGECELYDQYCEIYDPKKPRLRKHIQEGRIPRMKNGTPKDKTKNFEVRISKTVFTEYDFQNLLNFYPEAKGNDNESVATVAAKMAFTEIELIANNSKLNAHNSGMGGKRGALPYLSGITNLTAQHTVQPFDIAPIGFNGLNTELI